MVDVVIQTKKKKGKGWHESADYTGKAPEHSAVATRTVMETILKQPMQKANAVILSGEMWHGTNEENAEKILSSNEFRPSQYSSEDLDIPPDFGVGSYFDLNYENVSQYGDIVLKVRTTRPLKLFEAKSGSDKGFVQKNWEQLYQAGYDGAIYRQGNNEDEIVVFKPKGLIIPLYDVGQTDRDDAYSLKYNINNMLRQPLILADAKNHETEPDSVNEGLYQFITDYYNKELPKRIVWKGKDFSEKTAKIEQKKLGAEWRMALSPYDKDRFVVVKEEPKLPLNKYIDEYKKDLEIIYKQQRAKGKI